MKRFFNKKPKNRELKGVVGRRKTEKECDKNLVVRDMIQALGIR